LGVGIIDLSKEFYSEESLPSIELEDFFTDEELQKIERAFAECSFEENYNPLSHHLYEADFSIPVDIKEIVEEIIAKKIKDIKWTAYDIKHKTYKLVDPTEEPGFDIIFEISNWNPEWGGVVVYRDEEGATTEIEPKRNTCTLVERKPGIQSFIPYTNHYAKDRIVLIGKIFISSPM